MSEKHTISEALLKISLSIQQMRTSTDVEDVMTLCFEELRRFCDRIDTMAIHQVLDGELREVQTYRFGVSGLISAAQRRTAGNLCRVWETGEIYYQPSVQKNFSPNEIEYLASKFEGLALESMLDVPFSTGVVSVHSRIADAFTNDDVEMIKQVAEVFSVGFSRVKDLETIEELRRSEERYSLAVTAGKTGVWDLDVEKQQVYVDGNLWSLIGHDRESCVVSLDEWVSYVYADDYLKLHDLISETVSSQEGIYETEFRMLHADGSLRWFLARGKAVLNGEGGAVRLAGTNTDISDLKQMEKALQRARRDLEERVKSRTSELQAANESLQESQERLDAQFKGIPVPAYTWQRQIQGFVLVAHNEAALERTQGKVADYVEKTAEDWFKDPDFPILKDIERAYEKQTTIRRETRQKMPQTGRTLDLDVSYVFVKPDYVIVHTIDMTERNRLETQLRHAQKMDAIGRLAGGVAHDFSNLLTVINGYSTQMLLDPHAIDMRDAMEGIRSAGERASILTRRLLAFGKKQIMRLRPIQLNTVVTDMDKLLRRLIGEHIELDVDLAKDGEAVKADVAQMEQVVMNLVLNARDAMPNGGRILISTCLEEKGSPTERLPFVRLSVRDEGVGMSPELQEHIFEPFFTTKGQKSGTGLGLSITYGIVSQCGGWMEVDSQPDVGSTFSVCLPVTDEAAIEVREITDDDSESGRTGTILLVEDEALVRLFTCRILQVSGYDVIEATTGEEAIQKAAEFDGRIDLLLTDVVMPGLSGGDLAERMREDDPNLRVLFMSGYSDEEILRRGVTREDSSFLQKPFSRDLLVQQVQEAMG